MQYSVQTEEELQLRKYFYNIETFWQSHQLIYFPVGPLQRSSRTELPDGMFSKVQLGVNYGEPWNGKRLVYYMAIWNMYITVIRYI
jgi:hypothetical protein